ncbi:methyltransferase [Streptomyces sp. NPDC001404]|uniref:methyltransferase n=1 Tax=Streptomyces sp. NPDC001404 TaxID=3364571 RepID=UPI0036C3EF4B
MNQHEHGTEPLHPTDAAALPGAVADPVARMMQLTSGAWIAQALSAAATLGVADEMAAGPRPVGEIAKAVGVDETNLYRLLRALADAQVFEELPDRCFALTPVGELLREDIHGSMRGWAHKFARPYHRAAWGQLLEVLRTGRSGFDLAFGKSGFEYLSEHPDDAESLDVEMTSIATRLTAPIVQRYDFGRFGTVVDCGGGRGALLAAILSANPRVRGVLYDLPHVVERAGQPLVEAGVLDRCELVGGSFLDSVPAGGDAYLFSQVIHNWDDTDVVRILSNCRAQLRSEDSRVLFAEYLIPDDPRQPSLSKLIDLEMMVICEPGAQHRTREDFRRLFERAGLRLIGVTDGPGSLGLVEAALA